MCGIFGILQHASRDVPSEDLLQETAMRLEHRGPDGQGVHAAEGVGFVHTRLSLVDLHERSHQPFWDASRRYCLVYNGEIYDYADLRGELERAGVIFRTTSDTEVVLEALLHFGVESALPRLEGMFAFALYDAQEKTLVLARDRFGIKPLFIYDSEDAFVFCSTVRGMEPWITLRPNPLIMSAYLQGFSGPMSGPSFFEGVTLVPPGAVVRVRRGARAQLARVLTMNELVDPDLAEELAGRPRSELVDLVEELLLKSVESQLQADVPVGAFCSGGVDSSLIMAMAARSHSDLSVFHADMEGPASERSAAELLCKHLKLDLNAVTVGDHHSLEAIPDVLDHWGSPFVNPTTVPVLLVSRLVQSHGIKAVLTGEASDECFLGYEWLVPNVPDAARRLPGKILARIQGKLGLNRGDPGQSMARDRGLVTGLSNQFERVLGPAGIGDGSGLPYQAEAPNGLTTDAELSYILRTLLYRNDTMGMAASIESRFPFLDSRLVKVSASLPYDCKIRPSLRVFDQRHPFYQDKWIVRQVAARYLPPALSSRPKRMFPTSAFGRIQIDDGLFQGSFVADWYGLAQPRLRYLLRNASPALKLRLMLLEGWAHLRIRNLPKAELSKKLAQHVKFRAA